MYSAYSGQGRRRDWHTDVNLQSRVAGDPQEIRYTQEGEEDMLSGQHPIPFFGGTANQILLLGTRSFCGCVDPGGRGLAWKSTVFCSTQDPDKDTEGQPSYSTYTYMYVYV
jgi:hypothetical protein